jgi:protease-4
MTEPNTPETQASTSDRLAPLLEKLLAQTSDLADMGSDLLLQKTRGQRSTNNWLTMRRGFFAAIAIGSLLAYLVFYANIFGFQSDPLTRSVAVIPITGEIAPGAIASADNVAPVIQRACQAAHVDSLLLVINSGGGAPGESERMIASIEQCKHGYGTGPGKKVVALIDGVGASAAYMIAMHADTVYAGRYSLVGSIGAIMRLNDASELANRFGVREHTYRTSPLKGGPSLIGGPTPQDDVELQRLVNDLGRQFLDEVMKQRAGKIKLTRDQLFTGQVWTSTQALQYGLIDGLGTREELQNTLYKGMKMHDYKTHSTAGDLFGMKGFAKQIADELASKLRDDQPVIN